MIFGSLEVYSQVSFKFLREDFEDLRRNKEMFVYFKV